MLAEEANISVAMATYNGERYLGEQLASISQQTCLPIELIVCDDGSSDGTMAILADFAQVAPFEMQVLQNPNRLGYAKNFLQAVSLCRGDLIACADQDDVWLNTKLEIASRPFRWIDSPSVVVHSADLVDAELKPLGYQYPAITDDVRIPPSRVVPLKIWSGLALMFRRELLSAIPSRLFDDIVASDPDIGHDSWICFLAGLDRGFVLLSTSLVFYRQHASQITFGDGGERGAMAGMVRLLSTDGKVYLQDAEVLERWANIVRRALAEDAIAVNIGPALGLEDTMRRRAARLRQRSALYGRGANARTRATGMAWLLTQRAYRPTWRGGLGRRAVVKDLVVTVIGVRRGGANTA